MINIMKNRKIFFSISIIVIIVGIVAFIKNGLNFDVDFTGGTAISITIGKEFNTTDIDDIVFQSTGIRPSSVQRSGENEVIIKMNEISSEQREFIYSALTEKYEIEDIGSKINYSDNFSPAIGKEMQWIALKSSCIALILMLIYISIRFGFLSGFTSLVALLHDVLVMLFFYAVFRIPVNVSFVAAVLTTLGYSINDTIVIFDRIRENNGKSSKVDYDKLVDQSVNQTMKRSVFTSLTTIITISVLYFVSVPSIKTFTLPIIVGVVSGTYSSIFIASPLWAVLSNRINTKKAVRSKAF